MKYVQFALGLLLAQAQSILAVDSPFPALVSHEGADSAKVPISSFSWQPPLVEVTLGNAPGQFPGIEFTEDLIEADWEPVRPRRIYLNEQNDLSMQLDVPDPATGAYRAVSLHDGNTAIEISGTLRADRLEAVDLDLHNLSASGTVDLTASDVRISVATHPDQPVTKAQLDEKAIARSAHVTIAGSNMPEAIKTGADYACTGTDDQIIINQALSSLPAGGGRVVLMGDFFISNPIHVNVSGRRVHLYGANAKVVNLNTNGADAIFIQGSATGGFGGGASYAGELYQIIENLDITGNPASGAGIGARRVWGLHVRNNHVFSNGTHGIHFLDTTRNYKVTGNHIYRNAQHGVWDDSNVHQAIMANNHIQRNGNDNVRLTDEKYNVVVNANVIEYAGFGLSATNSGIHIELTIGRRLTITGNNIEANGNNIQMIGSQGNTSGITISGNVISDGIIDVAATGIHGFTIGGNTIDGRYGRGIELRECSEFVVSGNEMVRGGFPRGGNIWVRNSNLGSITGNIIEAPGDNRRGIYIDGAASTDIRIADNTLFNCDRAGISLFNAFGAPARITIQNNTIFNNGQGGIDAYGIEIQPDVTGTLVVGNRLYDTQAAATQLVHIQDSGTGTLVPWNVIDDLIVP
jgi:hypothetical protein